MTALLPNSKTYAEFFAGIGLIGEGLRSSGWSCAYANDVSAEKAAFYRSRNPEETHYQLADVNETDAITAAVPGRPFLSTASFPCIDLSVAGSYRGFDGRHSSTFFGWIDVLHALGERRPRMVLLENVTGFITAREGRDFKAAVQTLADLGYWLDAFVIDAKFFVPQSRPRVFVVGVDEPVELEHDPPRLLFGASNASLKESPLRPGRLIQALDSIRLSTGWLNLNPPRPAVCASTLEDVVDVDDGQDWWSQAEVDRHYEMLSDRHRNLVDRLREQTRRSIGAGFRRIRGGEQRLEVRFDGLAGCLRTPTGGSAKQIVLAVGDGILQMRWMSPREYARLQGVGDFPLSGTVNQQLRAFADAVCVPAVAWLDEQILSPVYEQLTARSDARHAGQSHA